MSGDKEHRSAFLKSVQTLVAQYDLLDSRLSQVHHENAELRLGLSSGLLLHGISDSSLHAVASGTHSAAGSLVARPSAAPFTSCPCAPLRERNPSIPAHNLCADESTEMVQHSTQCKPVQAGMSPTGMTLMSPQIIKVVSKKVWGTSSAKACPKISFHGSERTTQSGSGLPGPPERSLGAHANRLASTTSQKVRNKAHAYSLYAAVSHSSSNKPGLGQDRVLHLHDRWKELLVLNEHDAEADLIQFHRELQASESSPNSTPKSSLRTRSDTSDAGIKGLLPASFTGSLSESTLDSVPDKPRSWLLSPQSPVRQFWDVIGFCLIGYDVIMIPFVLAWSKKEPVGSSLFWLFIISLVYWSLNVPMNFCTAVLRDGELIYNPLIVAKSYAKSSLLLDLVVAGLDWTNFVLVIGGSQNQNEVRQLRALRVGRMFRAVKIRNLYNSIEESLVSRGLQSLTILMSIITIGATILATTHCLACFMFFLGQLGRETGTSNWLDAADILSLPVSYQYGRAFHWVLCQFTPAPNPITAQNETEQYALIILIFVSLIMIGSSLSRLNGAITLLKSKTAESEIIKRQIQLYLKVNRVSPDLSSRVMHCAEHVLKTRKIGMKKPEALSLLPVSLQEELAMVQKGSKVVKHPLFNLMLHSRPGLAKVILENTQPAFYEPNAVVFAEEKEAVCMYIVFQGKYQATRVGHESHLSEGTEAGAPFHRTETISPADPKWYAELCLFTRLSHVKSFLALTFGDALTLPSEALAQVVRTCPLAIVLACEYAQAIFAELDRDKAFGIQLDTDELPPEMCQYAACSTQLCSVLGKRFSPPWKPEEKPSRNSVISNFTIEMGGGTSHPIRSSWVTTQALAASLSTGVAASAASHAFTPAQSTATSAPRSPQYRDRLGSMASTTSAHPLEDLIQDVKEGKYDGDPSHLAEGLPLYFPELSTKDGIYMQMDHSRERARAVLAVSSALWTTTGKYESIIVGQPEATKLTEDVWERLQEQNEWAAMDQETLEAALVFLALRGLGKSKKFLRLCPITARREREDAVVAAMESRQMAVNLLPSTSHLSREQSKKVKQALRLSAELNLGQFVQGECVPERLNELKMAVEKYGEEVLKFYVLTSMWMMCGLTGNDKPQGSLFLNNQNAKMLLLAFDCLRQMGTWDSGTIYWSYIASRGQQLNFHVDTNTDDPQTLVLSRLVCMTRAQDEQGKASLIKAWKSLTEDERQALTLCFLDDGIEEQAFVFVFLPAFLDNAKANEHVTLRGGLLCLLKIIEMLYSSKSMAKTYAKTVNVDLSDAAKIIKIATSVKALDFGLEYAKILQNDNRVWIVMTARSWDEAQVPRKRSDPHDILCEMVKEVSRRQNALEKSLKTLSARAPSSGSEACGRAPVGGPGALKL
mmetsp:Transcript_7372/g.16003  ORF Transcript_7372/g.16003 Transcript_7372/m.16003 type:complete len:1388 (+) Transcript_7372:61-4224(+)